MELRARLLAALALATACHARAAAPTPPVIQIVVPTELSAEETERWITRPLESGLAGLSGLTSLQSVSAQGRALLTVQAGGRDVFEIRQDIAERIGRVDLPAGVHAQLAPPAAADGAVARVVLRGADLTELRTLADWRVRRRLETIAGVVDVAVCGGFEEEIHVVVDPARLAAVGRAGLAEVASALASALPGGALATTGAMLTVRSASPTFADLAERVVAQTPEGVPIRVRDVATVTRAHGPRTCVAALGGREVVAATVWARAGEDRDAVRAAAETALAALRRELPAGVTLDVVPGDRAALVAAPPQTLDELAPRVAPASGDALVEIGDGDGGLARTLPDEIRIVATEPAGAAARVAAATQGQAIVADAPTAWIRITGPDLAELARIADRLAAGEAVLERAGLATTSETALTPDRQRLALLGIPLEEVLRTTTAALGGVAATQIQEGERVIDVRVVLGPRPSAPSELGAVLVRANDGTVRPLSDVVTTTVTAGPRVILRADGARWVGLRVRSPDLAALRARVAAAALPAGYRAAVVE